MASSKPTSHLKEKSTSPSSTTSSGRRSPKPPGSPDHRLPTATALKPKSAPSTNAATSTATNNKSTTVSAVKRQPVTKKPAEKPPSPSRKPERTLSTPTTTRERSSSKLPPSTTHSPPTKPRAGNLLTSDHKGPKNVAKSGTGTGKKLGTTFMRSKSLEKTKEVVTLPNAFVDTNSSISDTEASPIKEVPEAAFGVKEHEEEVEQDHNPEQAESPVITDNAEEEHEDKESEPEVAENEEGTNEVKEKTEVKQEEVEQEEVEATQVDESPKEPVAEPVEEVHQPEINAVEAKVEAATPRGVVGTKKEVHQRSNDVIEEAKSKFLEKRKNKVLALVGAFETVMALQEPEAGQQGQQQQQPKKGKETEEESGIANESTESP